MLLNSTYLLTYEGCKVTRQTGDRDFRYAEILIGWFIGWGLTVLSTHFRLYRAFKVEQYYKYYK